MMRHTRLREGLSLVGPDLVAVAARMLVHRIRSPKTGPSNLQASDHKDARQNKQRKKPRNGETASYVVKTCRQHVPGESISLIHGTNHLVYVHL